MKLEKNKSLIALFLVSLVFVLDLRYFTSPPLRSDDWEWLVRPYIFDPLKIVNFADRRPFISTPLALLTPVFGLNVSWYYVVNWLLIFFSAIVVLEIIKVSFPAQDWLALPIALISLIYPVNYARTWLIVINNTFSLLLSLIAILLMVLYSRSGKISLLFFGNLFFLISLGMYEAGLGIVVAAALLLILFSRNLKLKKRILLGSFGLSAGLFFIYRTVLQSQILEIQDYYLANVTLNFSTILSRYIQGLFIFIFNWIGPLLFVFGESKYWVFFGIGLVALIIMGVLLPKWLRSAKTNQVFPFTDRIKQIKSISMISLIGGILWFAGYIPVIALWQPIFYGDGSRVNFSSIPGASIALIAGMAGMITLIVKRKEHIYRMLVIAIIPLLVLGWAYQIHSQNQRFRTWEINKTFWKSMFEEIPNVRDGTKLVAVIPGYTALEPFEMLPFKGDWEIQSAFSVLYNNPELFGEYFYMDMPGHPDDWVPIDEDLSRFLFVFYDPENSQFRIIKDIGSALNLPFETIDYDPDQRIIPYTSDVDDFRWLVD